MFWTGSLSSGV